LNRGGAGDPHLDGLVVRSLVWADEGESDPRRWRGRNYSPPTALPEHLQRIGKVLVVDEAIVSQGSEFCNVVPVPKDSRDRNGFAVRLLLLLLLLLRPRSLFNLAV
jgi:hypothetical protein